MENREGGVDLLAAPEGDEGELVAEPVSVFVAGQWDVPRKGHAGADGQFSSIGAASSWTLEQGFEVATLNFDGRKAEMIKVNNVRHWEFLDTHETVQME